MENKKHILVIDNDPSIRDLLTSGMSREGFRITCVPGGAKAMEAAETDPPDLILLDIVLDGVNGLELLKELNYNSATHNIPVIIISSKSDEIDIVLGLELGASDYVTKPFSIKVLCSRIRAVLRSQTEAVVKNTDFIRIGKLLLYTKQRKVTYNGRPVKVTNVEFNILELMVKKPGWVFSRSEIMNSIHDEEHKVTNNSINVHIFGLRNKLGEGKKCLQTVHNAGYRIVP